MTQFEIDCVSSIKYEFHEISKQLQFANQLKVLELKLKYPEATSMIDDIADKID